jgi:hypothetical protein
VCARNLPETEALPLRGRARQREPRQLRIRGQINERDNVDIVQQHIEHIGGGVIVQIAHL